MQNVADAKFTGTPVAEQHVHVSWRAILAGILVAVAVDILLTLLGFAVGLTAFEPTSGAVKAVGLGVGLWIIITAVASVFAGAYFGARVAGDPWKADGVAHGVVVWAAFLLLSLWLLASGAGKVLSAAGGLAGSAASALGSPDARGQALTALSNLGYSRSDAEQMLNQARQGAGNLREPGAQQQAAEAAKKAADQAAAGGAAASWIAFGIALLSLGGGVLGGMLGAMGEQKQVGRYARRLAVERERASGAST
jgi:RuvA, C-terminal domain